MFGINSIALLGHVARYCCIRYIILFRCVSASSDQLNLVESVEGIGEGGGGAGDEACVRRLLH